MNIYLTHNGTRLAKEGINLVAQNGNIGRQTIFADKVEQLIIMCKAEITSSARNLLFRKNIDTVFLTNNGRYLGRYAGRFSKNLFLRKSQIVKTGDEVFIKNTVRTIVKGKATNQLIFMQRLNRKRRERPFKKDINELKMIIKKVMSIDDIDAIRGYEGRASALFFRVYSKNFPKEFKFASRIRRPPTDPVNAVLSLLYTLLMNRVHSAVQVAGLDPYFGTLHAMEYGRCSLVLDLMEEFRTIIVDTLTLALFNLKILQPNDFTKEERIEAESFDIDKDGPDVRDDHDGRIYSRENSHMEDLPEQKMDDNMAEGIKNLTKLPVKLTDKGLKKVLSQFEAKLETRFFYPPLEQHINYKRVILEQARQYAKVIEGKMKDYTTLTLR